MLRTVGKGNARRVVSYKQLAQLGVDPTKPIDNPDAVLSKLAGEKETPLAPLPALQGSAKQIAWAEKIRASKDFQPFLSHPKITETGKKAIHFLQAVPRADFWIEHRDYTPKEMMEGLINGLHIGPNKRYSISKEGKITAKWNIDIQDGKGGYKKQVVKVVDDVTTWKF